MGLPELRSLSMMRHELGERENRSLFLVAVDQDRAKHAAAAPFADFLHASYADAAAQLLRQNKSPELLVMAFNDPSHAPILRQALSDFPSIKGVLSEEPLTQSLQETDELKPLLKDKFLSVNALILFSPVFDNFRAWLNESEMKPVSAQCVWHKDRTKDDRPWSSHDSHGLSILCRGLGLGCLSLKQGTGQRGDLGVKAQDVLYETDTIWDAGEIPVHFFSSYAMPEQKRAINLKLLDVEGCSFTASFAFDVGRNPATDTFVVTDDQSGKTVHSFTSTSTGILAPYQSGPQDKIGAFIKRSLFAYLHPEDKEAQRAIAGAKTAFALQKMLAELNPDNEKLHITTRPALNVLKERSTLG